MMAIVLLEHANSAIDLLKVVKMVLIHDVVEIDAGDTFLYDARKPHDNTAAERQAAERIFGLLPGAQAAELLAIWEEFEAGETAEAKFARAMDRLEPLLHQHGSTTLWQYAEGLLADGVAKGIL